jgi:hypothetical protein
LPYRQSTRISSFFETSDEATSKTMGNEQSVSADDLSYDNQLRQYDPYNEDDDDGYRIRGAHMRGTTSADNKTSTKVDKRGTATALPPRRHHLQHESVSDVMIGHVSTMDSAIVAMKTRIHKALADNDSVDTHSVSTSEGTEEDNSLVSYDEEEETEEVSGTTTYTNSDAKAQRSLYDTDDVTAMTDMAHDGDDEATAMSAENEQDEDDDDDDERPRQKLSKEEKRRARWKAAARRRRLDQNSRNTTDDEETIVIIDAEEEYSRSITPEDDDEQQDMSLGNPTGPTVVSEQPIPVVVDNDSGVVETSPTVIVADATPAMVVVAEDVQERSDKENERRAEEIVSRAVERASSHRDKPQRRRRRSSRGVATASTASKSDSSRHSDNADDAVTASIVESPAVISAAAAHDLSDPAQTAQSNHSATSSKQPRRARARIIVPATEVVPRKKSTKTSLKIVVASDVETSPQHKIGCFPGTSEQFASKKDAFHSIPVVRDASIAECSMDPSTSAGALPVVDAASKQQNMTVVVASDVEVGPMHQNIGCASVAASAPKMDVIHSISRPNPSTKGEASTRKQTRSSSKKRDVPIVMNGQIVGSSAAWSAPHAHAAKPTPETPSRSARRADSAPVKPPAITSIAPLEATSVPDMITQPIASVASASHVEILTHSLKSKREKNRRHRKQEPVLVVPSKDADPANLPLGVKPPEAATHGVTLEALHGTKKDINTESTIQNSSTSRLPAGDDYHASRPSAALEAKPLGADALQVQSRSVEPKPVDPPVVPRGAIPKDSLAAKLNRPDIAPTIPPDAAIVGGRPSTNENATSPLSTVVGSDVPKSEFLVVDSTGTKNGYEAYGKSAASGDNVVARDMKVAADPDGKSSDANSAKIQLPPSPNKKRGKSSRAADVLAVERASPNTTEKAIARAIDALSVNRSDDNEEIVRTSSPTTLQGKPKATSPKPEDARGNAKRQTETTPECKDLNQTEPPQTGPIETKSAPKLSCIGSGDDDLKLLTSDDYDYGIDLVLVEKYENVFNSILEKYPEFMARDAKMMEMLRVAKLQKILSVTLEVENELESHVKSLAVQKAEITSHYHSKLVEASRKRASREIVLQKTHDSALRDKRVLESQMTWQLITMCASTLSNSILCLAKYRGKV